MYKNVISDIFTFHDGSNSIGDGNLLNIKADYVLMNISVTGNATDFNLIFEAKANDTDDFTPIMCANLSTLTLSSNATANGKYQMSLEGLMRARVRISKITTGSVKVIATIVN